MTNDRLDPNRFTPEFPELEDYYQRAQRLITSRQDPKTGFLATGVAVPNPAEPTSAWICDQIYAALGLWGLALACRRHCPQPCRHQSLAHSVVLLMRSLMAVLMAQVDKAERTALRLSLATLRADNLAGPADPIISGNGIGLPLEGVSAWLLALTWMTDSGLTVVTTRQEAAFIQTLADWLSRACRPSQWGAFGGGRGIGGGSIRDVGMVTAALVALRDRRLFQTAGAPATTIDVSADTIAQTRTLLELLLVEQARAGGIDPNLATVVGFPAAVVDDPALAERLRRDIIGKLHACGCMRLAGGDTAGEAGEHRPAPVKSARLFTYACLFLDGLARNDPAQAESYRQRLDEYLTEFPERRGQESPRRLVPVWGLYLLGRLVVDGYLEAADCLPRPRRLRPDLPASEPVQVLLLAEDAGVQARLQGEGLCVQTLEQIQPVQVHGVSRLETLFRELDWRQACEPGARRLAPMGLLAACRAYTLQDGTSLLLLPPFYHPGEFYLCLDNRLLAARIQSALTYLQHHWDRPGRPLLTLVVTTAMLKAGGHQILLDLLAGLASGTCGGVPVRLGPLSELLATAATERLDAAVADLPAPAPAPRLDGALLYRLARPVPAARLLAWRQESDSQRLLGQLTVSRNLYERIELLALLCERLGETFTAPQGATLRELTLGVYHEAGEIRLWGVIRRAAGLLNLADPQLEDAVTSILLRRHRLSLGRAWSEPAVLDRPLSKAELLGRLRAYGGDDPRSQVLIQEIVVLLAALLDDDPNRGRDTVTLRPWKLLMIITGTLAREWRITRADAFEALLKLSPHALLTRLRQVLVSPQVLSYEWTRLEPTPVAGGALLLAQADEPALLGADAWSTWREIAGRQVPAADALLPGMRAILPHCRGLVVGDPLDRRSYLDSATVPADPDTAGNCLWQLLQDIQAPAYRQLNIEALSALAGHSRAHPEWQSDDYLILDVIIGTAVYLAWREANPELDCHAYSEHCAQAWNAFYAGPPYCIARYFPLALNSLLEASKREAAAA